MFTTGDKLLNVMKEEEVSIMELSRMSGVPERTIMDILAGIREPELGVVCRIADGLASVSMSFVPMRNSMQYPYRKIPLQS